MQESTKINHILFAYDSILFCRTTLQTSLNIQYLLEIYEQASGQKVSQEKTSMVFSKNVPHSQEEEIMDFWGIQHYHQYEKYLRLPPMVGKRKKKTFSDLKHKVWTELKGWKAKLLSQGDKEVLIKAVALSIPTYTMSCFKLPSTLCYELENLMAKFWWDQKKDENKMQWVSWKNMCESKSNGGMDFKDLHIFNQVLLAK